MDTKQVIVMRKDLNMRKGKMVAQGAHASMAVLLDLMNSDSVSKASDIGLDNGYNLTIRTLVLAHGGFVDFWLANSFRKICVYVNSEEELSNIYTQAFDADIPCARIDDNGATEFHGEKTFTCCAVGPWSSSEIDKITGDLPLL